MKKQSLLWLVCLCLLSTLIARPAQARYARALLEDIPVERLVENLTKQAAEKPKDVTIRFNLARVHAMAFALKTDTAKVRQGKADQGAWFGYAPRNVPFVAKPTEDAEALEAAKAQLALAIERYKDVLKLDPNNLAAKLGHAWCLQQAGKTMQAIDEYRKTIELGWKKESEMKRAPLGWHSVTAEAAGYLVPLLNKDADKEEIAALEERTKLLRRIPRPITPIAIPLSGGTSVEDVEDLTVRVMFDADGSGEQKQWTWIRKDAGWLVFDARGTGQITSALQMFGNVTFWMFWDNGYQALASLDNDGDGQLRGDELEHLAIWQDANGNGISERGEVRPVAAHGIVGLSCSHVTVENCNVEYSPAGVQFRDGRSIASFDIVLQPVVVAE